MTPAKRRPATPATKGPTSAAAKDGTPDAAKADAGGGSAPPAESGPVDTPDRATPTMLARSRGLHPERVWPD